VDFYQRFLTKGAVAIDIGAHTGDTTVPMALAAGNTGLVLAFEPNQYVYKIL
jgi:FkbM family methyltransferase